jgi:ParB family chromosome partitioning protein
MSDTASTMMISEITTRSPFKDLFTINHTVLKAIEDDMKKYGFDESAPIVLLKEGNVVIDGHTRLQAAKNAGLKEVDVCMADFDEPTAVEYAIHNQRDRRNITDADMLRCIEAVDNRAGRWPSKNPDDINFKVKSDDTAFKVKSDAVISACKQAVIATGFASSKVQEGFTILDPKNDKIKQEVLIGKKSMHAAAVEIRKEKRKDPLTAAYRQFEKDMKRIIAKAILNGIEVSQIKQVVKDLLKSKEASPCA